MHIADVAFFVREGSALDREAEARGTTVYLPDRRFNMLPEVLSESTCPVARRPRIHGGWFGVRCLRAG